MIDVHQNATLSEFFESDRSRVMVTTLTAGILLSFVVNSIDSAFGNFASNFMLCHLCSSVFPEVTKAYVTQVTMQA